MNKLLLLLIGGGAGAVARYALSGFVHRLMGINFPYGTLVINMLGCFLIGFLATLSDEKALLDINMRVFLMIGFLGAFTTFSTFILETAYLLDDGEILKAIINVTSSIVIGLIVVWAGILFGKMI